MEVTQRLRLHSDQRNSSLVLDQFCGARSCLNHDIMMQCFKEPCVYECVCVRQNTLGRECVETVSSSQFKWPISETLWIASISESA